MTWWLKFKDRKRCRHKFTLRTHLGFVVEEEQCVFEAEHSGMHCTRTGNKWMTRMDLQRILEDRGT